MYYLGNQSNDPFYQHTAFICSVFFSMLLQSGSTDVVLGDNMNISRQHAKVMIFLSPSCFGPTWACGLPAQPPPGRRPNPVAGVI